MVKPTIKDIAEAQRIYDANDVYNTSLSFFPDIKLAQLNREAAEKAVDVAKGAAYPKLSLAGSLGSQYSFALGKRPLIPLPDGSFIPPAAEPGLGNQINTNFSQAVQVSIRIPIFNGLTIKSNIKKAKISYEGSKISEQLAKNNLNKVIAQAVADLRAADSRYKSNEKTHMY